MQAWDARKVARMFTSHIRSSRFGGRLQRGGQADRAGVVHQHVDAAELLRCLLHGGLDRLFVAHIQLDRQRLAARLHDLIGDGVYRAGQFGMRLLPSCR